MNQLHTLDKYQSTVAKLGQCIDRMADNGFHENESWLCAKICNAMYYMCMSFRRMRQESMPGYEEMTSRLFDQAIQAIYEACSSYADTPEEHVLEGVVEGMKALHVFTGIRHTINQLFTDAQADKESSTSKSDISHSSNCDVCV